MIQVDATATLGGMPLPVDAWQIDCVTGGLQKCLGGPSGAGPITLSERMAEAVYRRRHIEEGLRPKDYAPGAGRIIGSNYFDLAMLMDYWSDLALNHHTEATSMLYAARECARIFVKEGHERPRSAATRSPGQALVAGVEAMGLKVFGDKAHKMPNVTGVWIPEGVAGDRVRAALLERLQHRDRHLVRPAAREDLAHRHDGRQRAQGRRARHARRAGGGARGRGVQAAARRGGRRGARRLPRRRRVTPMPKIAAVESGCYRVPLPVVLSDSTHGEMTHFELVTVRVRDADGAEGLGYTYTVGTGGAAIHVLVERYLAPLLEGEDADRIEPLWQKMWWALHYGGRGGPAVLAISAIDIALWDLAAKRAGQPLWRMLGGFDPRVPCYAGGIDLQFPLDQLLRQADDFRAQGFRAIKMKVGRDTPLRGRRAGARDAQAPRRRLPADGRRQHALVGRPRHPRRAAAARARAGLAGGADDPRRRRRATRASCARAACRSRPARTSARCGSSSR